MSNWVTHWAGRLGNNLQQVGNALMYSEYTNSAFEQHLNHEVIDKFSVIFGDNNTNIQHEFFCYGPIQNQDTTYSPCPNQYFNLEYIYANMQRILKTYVFPKLKLTRKKIDDDTLVVHIRSGDIFCGGNPWGKNYIQNPLSFYEKIITNFSKILIVTEPDNCNPIVEHLSKKNNVSIQSSNICDDFSTLISAKNLALSGVGTFGAAASILSPNLKNLYVSNLYLEEHLNYKMIKTEDINIHVHELKNYELSIEKCNWFCTQEQKEYLLNYKMEN